VLEDLLADWAEGGAAAVKMMRVERPAEYVRVMCSILPKERREPIGVRKATLASILRKSRPGVRLNEHLEHDDGEAVFRHACKMGLEGIVSKRLGSRYRSGRSPDWLKFKNPEAPAVKREAEEDLHGRGRPSAACPTRGLNCWTCTHNEHNLGPLQ
jgi:ATP-dependent DNA ligase